jgi:DNA-binding response OmpR family regulator
VWLWGKVTVMSAHDPKPRILIVEDDYSILHALSAFLSYSGFDVRGAQSGQEAIDLLRSFAPQLVILDLNMRPVSGWDILHWLRANELLPAVRVLVLTAMTRPEEQRRGLEEGAIDYITKPAQPSVLVERIRSILAMNDEQLRSLQHKRLIEQRLHTSEQAGYKKINLSIRE